LNITKKLIKTEQDLIDLIEAGDKLYYKPVYKYLIKAIEPKKNKKKTKRKVLNK